MATGSRSTCLPAFCILSIVMLLAFICPAAARGDDKASCHVVRAHEPSPAEKAYLDGKAGDAETLYREALSKTPHDAFLTAALVRTLLREQKIDDASSTIAVELNSAPNSVPLLTASAEVAYRQGKIAEAATTADQAFKIDPCNPRLYLLRARIFQLNSMYASERRAINFAHALDPSDMDIGRIWLGTLPLAQRIDTQKQFLATANGMDPEERKRAEKDLSNLVSQASNSDKTCHMVSTTSSTDLPLVPVAYGGNSRHIESWGLHVFFNSAEATLAVDTGASGLLVNRAIADRAGLKSAGREQIGGVGDQGASGGYVTFADSIRVGSLEFHDCMVRVTDRKDILGMDGLIGTDVFSSYLVTLDYPMRKFLLSQLPPRPSDSGRTVVALNTGGGEQVASTAPGSAAKLEEPQDRYVAPAMKDYSPVFRSGHFLVVPTLLNGKAQGLFMVDTGAYSTSISPGMARSVTKVHGGPGTIQGLSGSVAKVLFSEAILFQFAGIQQQNNDLVSFDTLGLSRGAGFEISGFLGSTVLRQLTISIDYRDGLIKFDYDPRHGNHNF